jgi:hypothetical protein
MSLLHKRRLKALEVESLLDQSLEKMILQSKLLKLRKTKELKLIQEQNMLWMRWKETILRNYNSSAQMHSD